MPITLTVTDDATGTSATATVAGSGVLADNIVLLGRADGIGGALAFGAGGSRVGDGTIPLTVTPGLWWAYLTSDGVFSGLYYFSATDGLAAVATRCRWSVRDTIRLLSIPPAARVYEQAFPDPSDVEFPCTLVTVDGVQETEETGLSTRDDRGRPIKIQIADRADRREVIKRLPEYEFWRQSIERCFINQRLAGVPESIKCKIEPYVIIDPSMPQYEYMVSGLVVRAICREPRGVGV